MTRILDVRLLMAGVATRGARRVPMVAVVATLALPAGAQAETAPNLGTAWSPPAREAQYATGIAKCRAPFTPFDAYCDPAYKEVQADRSFGVPTSDGETIHVEVWSPHQDGADGPLPPSRVPVVAEISPYYNRNAGLPAVGAGLVKRGYAYAVVHMRGTGASTGCFDVHSSRDADDGARVVEQLANAPWSTGRVALLGLSYPATAAMNVAARGDRGRLRGLKTIVPVSPLSSPADFRTRDGVVSSWTPSKWLLGDTLTATTYTSTPRDGVAETVQDRIDRTPCRLEGGMSVADTRGGVNDWEVERDLRLTVGDISVPTLFTMGLLEDQLRNVPGLFDQIGSRVNRRVRKVGLFGQWGHVYPDQESRIPGWERTDWSRMLVAWLDRWLLRVDNGVEEWPVVQIQDSSGQWRVEPDYPLTGGPVGQLALGEDGLLGAGAGGAADPAGADVVPAAAAMAPRVQLEQTPDTALEWTTPALQTPLRVTGVAVLDAWVQLEKPGGQLVAELIGIDAAGRPLRHTRRLGARGLRYLDPIVDNRFAQREPRDPAVNAPVSVQLRFEPADFVIPAGSRLRLRVGRIGPATNGEVHRTSREIVTDRFMTLPDTDGGDVTILHDCEHPTALRFLMPRAIPELIDVEEKSQEGALGAAGPVTQPLDDPAGGIAAEPVCGQAPLRLDSFGGPR